MTKSSEYAGYRRTSKCSSPAMRRKSERKELLLVEDRCVTSFLLFASSAIPLLTLLEIQRSRVGLARAVYCRAATVIIDDALSALDMGTARFVYENCFRGEIMRGRTVVRRLISYPRFMSV